MASGSSGPGGHKPPKEISWAYGGLLAAAGVVLVAGGAFVAYAMKAGWLHHNEPQIIAHIVHEKKERAGVDYDKLLAAADPAQGEAAAAMCKACHSMEPGVNGIMGPTLHDVTGRDIASVSGFTYSAALTKAEGDWDPAALDAFLENPKRFAPGTSMQFAGLNDAKDRINVIAWLRTHDADAPPAPPAPATVAVAPEEPKPTPSASTSASPAATATPKASASAEPAAPQGLRARVAAGDVANGEKAAAMCKACHSVAAGGPNMMGPTIHGVVGRDIAGVQGFTYSEALKGAGGAWTLEKLDRFLENPAGFAAGNTMAYPGVKAEQDRIDMIAWLASLK